MFYFKQKFYVLANKYKRKLGYYLLELDTDLYDSINEPRYILKWENKLEIGDAGLAQMVFEGEDCLVVSYKSMHVNSYSVLIVGIDSCKAKYKHESY